VTSPVKLAATPSAEIRTAPVQFLAAVTLTNEPRARVTALKAMLTVEAAPCVRSMTTFPPTDTPAIVRVAPLALTRTRGVASVVSISTPNVPVSDTEGTSNCTWPDRLPATPAVVTVSPAAPVATSVTLSSGLGPAARARRPLATSIRTPVVSFVIVKSARSCWPARVSTTSVPDRLRVGVAARSSVTGCPPTVNVWTTGPPVVLTASDRVPDRLTCGIARSATVPLTSPASPDADSTNSASPPSRVA